MQPMKPVQVIVNLSEEVVKQIVATTGRFPRQTTSFALESDTGLCALLAPLVTGETLKLDFTLTHWPLDPAKLVEGLKGWFAEQETREEQARVDASNEWWERAEKFNLHLQELVSNPIATTLTWEVPAPGHLYSRPKWEATDEQKARYQELVDLAIEVRKILNSNRDRIWAEEQAVREAKEEKKKADKAQLDSEKDEWIQAHGSNYLKAAYKAKYDCRNRYYEERLNFDLIIGDPTLKCEGFILDWKDEYKWQDRSCPSEKALYLVKSIRERMGWDINAPHDPETGKVVWLKKGPKPEDCDQYCDDCNSWTPCEGVILNWLGDDCPAWVVWVV